MTPEDQDGAERPESERPEPPLPQRVQVVCLVVLTTLAVGAALRWLAPVMIPFVLAVFFAFILSPLIEFQVARLRMPRAAAISATLALAILLFGGVAALVSVSVGELAANAVGYQEKAADLLNATLAMLPLERFGIDAAAVTDPFAKFSVSALGNVLLATTNAILDILSNGLLVLIFLVFLLLGAGGRPPDPNSTWSEIDARIKRYLMTKGVLSAATGVLVGGVLSALRIDLALVFGLFAFLLNFIPSIGSVIATLLPLPVVIASPDVSLLVAVLAIAIPGAIQFTIGNLIEPTVMGESLDLHPVAILMNLIIWGMLWGIVGMLLSTPILVVIKILCEKFEGTKALAALLAGRIAGLRA
jgi:AI-2 transport protein TqsA